MATSPKLVQTADQFLAKRRFNFFFYSFDVGRYWFEVQVGRSAGDENILCSFFFPQIRSWLHFLARWNIHCVQLWIMFTLALLTSFSGVAMVKRGIGAFCTAETNPLARRAKLLSADQSDSVQLGSAGFGSRRFLAVFGVQSRFLGWVLLILTGGRRDVPSESDALCRATVVCVLFSHAMMLIFLFLRLSWTECPDSVFSSFLLFFFF